VIKKELKNVLHINWCPLVVEMRKDFKRQNLEEIKGNLHFVACCLSM